MIPGLTCQPAAAVIQAIFVCLLVVGAGWDIASRRLPNWLTLSVAVLFIPWAIVLGMSLHDFLFAALAGGICLALGFGLFQLRVMGAGDVKLIVAMALWIGLTIELMQFILYMGLVGGVLAMLFVAARLFAKRDLGELPYGVAIVLAGLYVQVGNSACFAW